MEIRYKNKKFSFSVKEVSEIGKFIGLMFKSKETANLLFKFKKKVRVPIHSWFVFFRFLAVWLDDKNKIVEFKLVKPFEFYVVPKKDFSSLIELPLNNKNKELIRFFVGKGKI